jgi:hypothetical protein
LAEQGRLERALSELGWEIDYPPTPDLRRLVGEQIRPRRRRPAIPRWAWAAAAALLIAALAVGLIPPARDAVAEWLGIPITIKHVKTLPSPSPRPSTSDAGQRLQLGTPMTLDEAQAKVRFRIQVPDSLGAPDEVYYHDQTGVVFLVYHPRPGLPESAQTGVGALLMEGQGSYNTNFFGKFLGPNTKLETVRVGGVEGYWIEGQPHDFFFQGPRGENIPETFRLADNTLLWQKDGVVYRVEAHVSKADALRLGGSMR